MDKIMFNDKFRMTDAVIDRRKTMTRRKKAKYRVGQIVGIAQCYKKIIEEEYLPSQIETEVCRLVRANHKGCTNKMYVSGDHMPHHIKFTDCKQERLQDISDEDCLKEGVERRDDVITSQMESVIRYQVPGTCRMFATPQEAFAFLIDKVEGKGTWESNPTVYAYEFELIN
ncbi:MAG: hypothetical protein IJQ32_03310 [Paludibacteraceae bacterium]|nr:hypothetical protein [Paludibacteraceae bacterium]